MAWKKPKTKESKKSTEWKKLIGSDNWDNRCLYGKADCQQELVCSGLENFIWQYVPAEYGIKKAIIPLRHKPSCRKSHWHPWWRKLLWQRHLPIDPVPSDQLIQYDTKRIIRDKYHVEKRCTEFVKNFNNDLWELSFYSEVIGEATCQVCKMQQNSCRIFEDVVIGFTSSFEKICITSPDVVCGVCLFKNIHVAMIRIGIKYPYFLFHSDFVLDSKEMDLKINYNFVPIAVFKYRHEKKSYIHTYRWEPWYQIGQIKDIFHDGICDRTLFSAKGLKFMRAMFFETKMAQIHAEGKLYDGKDVSDTISTSLHCLPDDLTEIILEYYNDHNFLLRDLEPLSFLDNDPRFVLKCSSCGAIDKPIYIPPSKEWIIGYHHKKPITMQNSSWCGRCLFFAQRAAWKTFRNSRPGFVFQKVLRDKNIIFVPKLLQIQGKSTNAVQLTEEIFCPKCKWFPKHSHASEWHDKCPVMEAHPFIVDDIADDSGLTESMEKIVRREFF